MESSIAVAMYLRKKRKKIDPLLYLAMAILFNFILIGCLVYGLPVADTALGKVVLTVSVAPCLIAVACVWLGVEGLISEMRRR